MDNINPSLTILVTGGTGFVGNHCVEMLINQGHTVYATYNTTVPKKTSDNLIWLQVDLLNSDSIKSVFATIKPDAVLHAAWYVEHKDYLSNPNNIAWLIKSIELIKTAIGAGCKRIVTIGSCLEYSYDSTLCNPNDFKLNSLYGACKRALFETIYFYAKANQTSYGHARLFYLYGPGEKSSKVIPYIVNSLLKGGKAYVSDGSQVKDYIYISDAAKIITDFLLSEIDGAVDVGTGFGSELKNIFIEIGKNFNGSAAIEFGNRDKSKEDLDTCIASLDWMKSNGYNYKFIAINDGIRKTVNWWRERNV